MPDSVDPKSLDSAKRQARSTGVPQPVKSRAGKVLYYVDRDGAVIPTVIAIDQRQRSSSTTSTTRKSGDVLTPSGGLSTPAQRGEMGTPGPTAQQSGMQEAWIDGRMVWLQVDGTGKWVAHAPNNPTDKGTSYKQPSAFDALDGAAIDPKAPFIMGTGYAGSGPGAKDRAGQTDSQVTASMNGSRGAGALAPNAMSVEGGVAWLANLSTKDPGAYAAMLQKLYDAGYLTKAQLAAAAGHWSAAAGQAFAEAARDTAVVNTTAEGKNTTLDAFLTSKAGAAAAAEGASGDAYKPTPRSYTDPEDIKASAKTEAEKVLGRHLTPEEETQLVSHFRSLEDAAFDQIDAAQGKGGARYTPPGTGQIGAYVSGPEHEQEAANFRAAGYGMALKRLVGLG